MMTTESGGEGFSEDQEEIDDGGEEDDMSQASTSSKRQRRGSRSGSCGSAELLWAAVYVDPNLGLNRRRSASAEWSADAVADADADAVAAVAVAVADRGAVYDKPWPAQGTGISVCGAGADACGVGDAAGGAGGVSPPMIGGDDIGAARDRGDSRRRRRASPALISNMVTTSIAESSSSSSSSSSNGASPSCATKDTFEYSDWEEIKETLARASEFCDCACFVGFFSLSPLAPSNSTFSHPPHPHVCDDVIVYPYLALCGNRRRHDERNAPPPGGDPRMLSVSRAVPRSFRFFLEARRRSETARRIRFPRLCRGDP
jgi:hypothetical protein